MIKTRVTQIYAMYLFIGVLYYPIYSYLYTVPNVLKYMFYPIDLLYRGLSYYISKIYQGDMAYIIAILVGSIAVYIFLTYIIHDKRTTITYLDLFLGFLITSIFAIVQDRETSVFKVLILIFILSHIGKVLMKAMNPVNRIPLYEADIDRTEYKLNMLIEETKKKGEMTYEDEQIAIELKNDFEASRKSLEKKRKKLSEK